jgi:hypothetical protein
MRLPGCQDKPMDRYSLFTVITAGKKAPAGNAQGIEAEIPQALPQVKDFTCGKAEELERKARSGRGEPEVRRGRMRPKQEDQNCYAFILRAVSPVPIFPLPRLDTNLCIVHNCDVKYFTTIEGCE